VAKTINAGMSFSRFLFEIGSPLYEEHKKERQSVKARFAGKRSASSM
jgi:hypothetical protein